MTRFANPDEVRFWAEGAARGDIQRHRELGHDLNVYCTPGARADWQRGFDNAPARSWEEPTRTYDTMFQRGRAVARLLEQEARYAPMAQFYTAQFASGVLYLCIRDPDHPWYGYAIRRLDK